MSTFPSSTVFKTALFTVNVLFDIKGSSECDTEVDERSEARWEATYPRLRQVRLTVWSGLTFESTYYEISE
jgi:hypothetical protein